MKNVTMRLTIAAAAFVAVAGMASAQTMEANIPFAFHANGKAFAAGTYRVNVKTGNFPMLIVRSRATGESALASGHVADPSKSGDDVLTFECGSGCYLSKASLGNGAAYAISVPKLGKDEPRRTAEIVMRPAAD